MSSIPTGGYLFFAEFFLKNPMSIFYRNVWFVLSAKTSIGSNDKRRLLLSNVNKFVVDLKYLVCMITKCTSDVCKVIRVDTRTTSYK